MINDNLRGSKTNLVPRLLKSHPWCTFSGMKPVKTDVHFPALEESILAFWNDNGLIEKGLRANEGKTPFLFYDGPPFATGLPHYGHILAGTLKDIVPRYWVMKGRYVERRWGWDCHGLPVEYEMEKELGLQGLEDLQKIRDREVQRVLPRHRPSLHKGMGKDHHPHRALGRFQKRLPHDGHGVHGVGLVGRQPALGKRPHLRRLPGDAVLVADLDASFQFRGGFELQRSSGSGADRPIQERLAAEIFPRLDDNPWTLPSNLALAVNPEIKYVEVLDAESGQHYVLAEARLGAYYKDPSQYRVVREMAGRELEGEPYEPIFPYFQEKRTEGAFKVVLGDYVTTTDGTGIVHTAPAFGEDDFLVCQKYGIPLVNPVDAEGKFTAPVNDFVGLQVKDADKLIIKDLKTRGALVKHDTIVHNYPFCWRSDTP